MGYGNGVSKAKTGMKLIKWLANQADDVAASADDLKRFGPQAAKVRSLLDFIPTMSDDAARASGSAWNNASNNANNAARNAAYFSVWNNARNNADNAARNAAWDAADGDTYDAARNALRYAADSAANATSVGDLIDPNTYRTLTNPLAAGRAVDILGNRPRNQGLPFYDIVRQMGESGVLRTPRDVVIASRLAKAPDNVREVALFLMNNNTSGMTRQDILTNARLLA